MGQRLALVVGVSEYGEGFEPLPGSLRDVQAMQAVLQKPDCGAFETQALENCDRSALEAKIEQFFRGKSPDDVLLFYFSGHGDLGSGGMLNQQLHFCTRNSTKQDKRLVESSALSASFLKRQMDLSKSQQIIVILDCCYSGAIGDLLKKGDEEIDYGELKANGRVILASSSAAKVSLQAKDGLSLYTRYLIEGMEGAAYPGQGAWIVAQSLHDYADRRFEIENKGYPPKIIADDTGFNLPIVRSPKPDSKLEYRKMLDRIFQQLDEQQGLDFNGEIADKPLVLRRLEIAQRKGIDPDFAAKVLEEVQTPYRSRAIKFQDYADTFRLATQNGTLPDEYDRQLLTEIRQDLGIGEAQADRIEQKLAQELNLNPVNVPGSPPLQGGARGGKTSAEAPPLPTPAKEPEWNVDRVPLETEKGANYTKLRDLLRAKKWKEADYETYRIMITIVGRKEGDWFRTEDLLNFPCKDLKTIDRLWVQASQGRYGFSVQKEIYVRCGAKLDGEYPGDEIWRKFGTEVGWRVNNEWQDYDDLTWNSIHVPGHLPVVVGTAAVGGGRLSVWCCEWEDLVSVEWG